MGVGTNFTLCSTALAFNFVPQTGVHYTVYGPIKRVARKVVGPLKEVLKVEFAGI